MEVSDNNKRLETRMGKGNRKHESGKGREEKRGTKVGDRNKRGSEYGGKIQRM